MFGGGVERVSSLLSKSLSDNYEISILTLNHFKNRYKFTGNYFTLQNNTIRHSRINLLFRLYWITNLVKIRKLLTILKPDLIISFTTYVNFLVIFTKFILRFKTPLFISEHCNPVMQYKDKSKFYHFLIRIFYSSNCINKFITISNDLKSIIERIYKVKMRKMINIYNPIDLTKIKLMAKERIEDYYEIFNNENIFKFIAIGRLSEEKGYENLIKAFSKVKNELVNTKLFILGDGPLRTQLKENIRIKGLEKDVILLGLKQNPFQYLIKADVFVLSSHYEALPMVLIEALACEKPIISTHCQTGPSEILCNGKYGLLVDLNNPNDLADKMIYLAGNQKLCHQFSKRATDRVKYFELHNIKKIWINLINTELKNA